MNLRNRKLLLTVRILLGLFILFSGLSGLWAGTHDMQTIPAPMVPSMRALWSMGIFQMIKVTETVVGLMLITGFLPALAAIFLAPICVGVIVFDLRVGPSYLPSGLIVTALTAYLGYAYWDKYKQLFQRN